MTNARAHLAVFALLVVGAGSAIAPALSQASISNEYYCVSKPANQWCDGQASGTYGGLHSWDYNEAEYTGWPEIVVCERVWKPSTGGVLLGGPSCDWNWTARLYGNVTCACYEAEVKHTSIGTYRTIWGFSVAN